MYGIGFNSINIWFANQSRRLGPIRKSSDLGSKYIIVLEQIKS